MKKVMYVVEAFGGGVFTYIVEMANELAKEYEVYVVYAIRNQTPENYKDYFDESIHLIHMPNLQRKISLKKDYATYRELKKIEKEIKPDIIHLHSSKAGVLGRLAFRRRKDIKVFYTPHGYSFMMINQKPTVRKIYWLIEKMMVFTQAKTIACSYGEFLEAFKLSKNSTYVNNGVDTEALKKIQEKVKDKNQEFTVCTIGRICSQKNPRMFEEIAERVPDVKFKWIGDGEQRDKLRAVNIDITGWMTRDQVIEEACKADMFILTSLWEGLPIALLEAMYLGKVVAVTDVVGNRDVIHSGINGYVCQDVYDFVKIINLEKRMPQYEIAKQAKLDVEVLYSLDNMFAKYRELYEED